MTPPNNSKIEEIGTEIERIFNEIVGNKIQKFEVLKKKDLPNGLKQHTRSICWLAEQVILQNTKKYAKKFNLTDFEYPPSDISPWDVKFRLNKIINERDIFVNVKITDVTKPARKNDIASVKTLLNFYKQNQEPLLFYAVMKFKFDKNSIIFEDSPVVRYYPWIKDFVVNPRNEHIQCFYEVDVEERSIEEFLELLKNKAIEKGLKFT